MLHKYLDFSDVKIIACLNEMLCQNTRKSSHYSDFLTVQALNAMCSGFSLESDCLICQP